MSRFGGALVRPAARQPWLASRLEQGIVPTRLGHANHAHDQIGPFPLGVRRAGPDAVTQSAGGRGSDGRQQGLPPLLPLAQSAVWHLPDKALPLSRTRSNGSMFWSTHSRIEQMCTCGALVSWSAQAWSSVQLMAVCRGALTSQTGPKLALQRPQWHALATMHRQPTEGGSCWRNLGSGVQLVCRLAGAVAACLQADTRAAACLPQRHGGAALIQRPRAPKQRACVTRSTP